MHQPRHRRRTSRPHRRRTGRPHRRRLRAAAAATAIAAAALPAVTALWPALTSGTARADEVTASQDTLRDGWDSFREIG